MNIIKTLRGREAAGSGSDAGRKSKIRVLALVYDGFEEAELVTPVDWLRRAGAEVTVASAAGGKLLTGTHNIKLIPDAPWRGTDDTDGFDCLFMPGGGPNARALRDDDRVIALLKKANAEGKVIAAICAAPIALERAGIIAGRRVTSYPGCLKDESACAYETLPAVRDGNIVTGRGPGAAAEFGFLLVEVLFGAETARGIAGSAMYPHAQRA